MRLYRPQPTAPKPWGVLTVVAVRGGATGPVQIDAGLDDGPWGDHRYARSQRRGARLNRRARRLAVAR